MKKSLIAGAGVAAFGLAVLPVAGVFADPVAGNTSVVDELTVVVDESCTFQATQGTGTDEHEVAPGADGKVRRQFEKTATLGELVYLGDASAEGGDGHTPTTSDPIAIKAVCNAGTGSSGSTSTKTGTWTINAKGDGATATLQQQGTGATGTILSDSNHYDLQSGTESGWSFKINNIAGATSSYTGYSIVPGSGGADIATGDAGTEFSFEPSYRIYVGTEQASGTYKGNVTYTISSVWTGA